MELLPYELVIPEGSQLTTGLEPGHVLKVKPVDRPRPGALVAMKADGLLRVAPYDIHDRGEMLGVVIAVRMPLPSAQR